MVTDNDTKPAKNTRSGKPTPSGDESILETEIPKRTSNTQDQQQPKSRKRAQPRFPSDNAFAAPPKRTRAGSRKKQAARREASQTEGRFAVSSNSSMTIRNTQDGASRETSQPSMIDTQLTGQTPNSFLPQS